MHCACSDCRRRGENRALFGPDAAALVFCFVLKAPVCGLRRQRGWPYRNQMFTSPGALPADRRPVTLCVFIPHSQNLKMFDKIILEHNLKVADLCGWETLDFVLNLFFGRTCSPS